ncbi:hypothetical protein [Streptomyces sp. NPDC091371]|uniref:hypothetical protein n=1 Tax=Streptomyces sp. NPDC091371 TaxID=3155303 RepID=UPI00343171C1
MNTIDPVRWILDHRAVIVQWTVVTGAALLIFLLVRYFVMKKLGGWRAAWRRLMRELAVTAAAFASPVRAWLRYRRVLRMLVRRLGDPESWRDAERALAVARLAAAPARPYAALVDDGHVTVLLAGRRLPVPPEPWEADEEAPGEWTVPRSELPAVVPEAGLNRPVIVAIGAEDAPSECCAFLDTASGPPVLALDGDRRAAAALLPALAAQLGVRLPSGQVIVADGVLRGFPAEPVREAYRTAKDTPARLGIAPFLVAPELPDPLPPELAGPPGDVPLMRVIVRGPGRGYVRGLYADGVGQLAVPGTPLLLMAHALPRAVARTLKRIPPVHPPAPTADGALGLFEEFEEADEATAAGTEPELERDLDAGVPATSVGAAAMGSGARAAREPIGAARGAESVGPGTSPAVGLLPAAEPAGDPDAGVAPAPAGGPDPDPDPDPGPEPGGDPDSGPGSGTGGQPDPDPGTSPDPGRDPDPGTSPDPGRDPDPGTSPDPGTDPDPGTPPDPGSDPDPGTDPDSEPGTGHAAAGTGEVPDHGSAPATPLIWAGSDPDPGVWTGLAGSAPRGPGAESGAGAGTGPEPDPVRSGPAPGATEAPPGAEPEGADPDGSDPDAGVPTGPSGPR